MSSNKSPSKMRNKKRFKNAQREVMAFVHYDHLVNPYPEEDKRHFMFRKCRSSYLDFMDLVDVYDMDSYCTKREKRDMSKHKILPYSELHLVDYSNLSYT